jgi:hypothetical protein
MPRSRGGQSVVGVVVLVSLSVICISLVVSRLHGRCTSHGRGRVGENMMKIQDPVNGSVS